MKLFLCYEHADLPLVIPLVDILLYSQFDVWFGQKLQPDQNWKKDLRRAIGQSDVFIYTLAPLSVQSEWCLWELAQAIRMARPIVPVLLYGGVEPPDVLRGVPVADFSNGQTPRALALFMGGFHRVAVTLLPESAPPVSFTPNGIPAHAVPCTAQVAG
ncbi:MAG: toll/interleukin-1 receptor domain-containing protein [Anaerolineae bacterium]|nr:toll/interleukin-1 receptor domain-containing protein [Anaerolineae bacterium]